MALTLVRNIKSVPKNILINGDMFWAEWRTSTALSSTNRFTCDRWLLYRDLDLAGSTGSRQSSGIARSPFCLRIQRDSGNSALNPITAMQNVETALSRRYAGKTLTVSFLARCGATYSPTGSSLGVSVASGTGTDQSMRTGLTGQQNIQTTSSVALTTTFQRFTQQVVVPANATQLAIQFYMTPVGTAGASDYFEITEVAIQETPVFMDFSLHTESNAQELIECKRFYQRGFMDAQGPAISASSCFLYYYLPVTMRTAPTVRQVPGSSFSNAIDETGTLARTPTTVVQGIPSTTMIDMNFTGAAGMTIYRPCRLTSDTVEAYSEMI